MPVLKTKLHHDFLRIRILWVMPRRQSFCTQCLKRILNDSSCRLHRQSMPPKLRPQMKSNLRDRPIRPQPATTNMLPITQQKNRPILKPGHFPPLQLALPPHPHFLIRKRSAKIPRHLYIAPKPPRQRKILLRPPTKPQPLTFQKIRIEYPSPILKLQDQKQQCVRQNQCHAPAQCPRQRPVISPQSLHTRDQCDKRDRSPSPR